MEMQDYSYDYETSTEDTNVIKYRPIEFGINVGLGW
jgi:hypothetical protein